MFQANQPIVDHNNIKRRDGCYAEQNEAALDHGILLKVVCGNE